ncbi:MAG: hypothetical protein JWR80_9758 [Bradyrhizobium sp.]|nr:hypothetical protein [Bradyrhizobium sp.]
MVWKHFTGPRAITSRRRVVASAVMYGLSLTVRFTSATGDETEISPQAVQSANPVSIIFYKDWPAKPAPPIGFHGGQLLGSRGCQMACERPTPMSVMSNCAAP